LRYDDLNLPPNGPQALDRCSSGPSAHVFLVVKTNVTDRYEHVVLMKAALQSRIGERILRQRVKLERLGPVHETRRTEVDAIRMRGDPVWHEVRKPLALAFLERDVALKDQRRFGRANTWVTRHISLNGAKHMRVEVVERG